MSMSIEILPTIMKMISGSGMDELSNKTGLSTTQVTSAAAIALPLIIQAMAKKTEDDKGAESLAKAVSKDHDGSILENLGSYIQNSDEKEGQSILKHLIGKDRTDIAQTIGNMVGIEKEQSMLILSILAPIVMGLIGKYMSKENVSASELSKSLSAEGENVTNAAPDASSLFKSLIDYNGDGEVTDDVMKIGSQLLGAFLK
jgi:hypothetical protein